MDWEGTIIRGFVVSRKRQRCLEQLADSRRRRTFLDRLAHFQDFDSRYISEAPPARHSPDSILQILLQRGAPPACHVISEDSRDDPSIDGRVHDLGAVLRAVVGSGMGSLLCCLPGRLAWYEGEDNRFLLERPVVSEPETLVRFVGAPVDEDSGCELGIFHMASDWLEQGTPSPQDERALRSHLHWFAENLGRPSRFSRANHPFAICWFRSDATEAMRHAWAMVRVLERNGVVIRKLTTTRPGFVVYEDELQVTAEPFRDGTF